MKGVLADGRLQVRALGGAFPWVYGEGIVDLLGDQAVLHGVLSFGSRHVSHESPQKVRQDEAPLRWQDAWVETKCRPHEIEAAGVRPGTRMVIGKHRKRPFRIKDYIASYTLDNKASLAILLGLAERLPAPASDGVPGRERQRRGGRARRPVLHPAAGARCPDRARDLPPRPGVSRSRTGRRRCSCPRMATASTTRA